MNKARITYRLDQNRNMEKDRQPQDDKAKVIPLYQEEYRVVEEQGASRGTERGGKEPSVSDYQSLQSYSNDYGAWNSPFDAETQRIEELIRSSEEKRERKPPIREQRRYDEEDKAESYNGQTGYYDIRNRVYEDEERNSDRYGWEGPSVTGPRYVRHSRSPWMKITLAVAGAATTGVLLGLLALSLFSGEGLKSPDSLSKLLSGESSTKAPVVQDAPAAAAVNQTAEKQTDAVAVNGAAHISGQETSVAISAKNYYLLQNGSFAGAQGAEQAVGDLKKKGLAAVFEQADKHYVYVGLATDKESAQALGKQLQTSKVDIYEKAYSLPAIAKIYWGGEADTLKSYLDQSDKLLQMFSRLTLLHLEEAKPTPIDDATLQSVKTAHESWAALANSVAQKAPEGAKAALSQMNNSINSAKQSIDQYKKNPSAPMLWQAQNGMLQFLIAEKELLSLIAVK